MSKNLNVRGALAATFQVDREKELLQSLASPPDGGMVCPESGRQG
jgi:hypothetical protein